MINLMRGYLKKNIIFIGILCILTVVVAVCGCTNQSFTNTTKLSAIVVNPGQSIQSTWNRKPGLSDYKRYKSHH